MDRLKGKVAIVTGGAAGIGEATTRLFAQEGAKVVIADIDRAKGERVAGQIGQDGGEAVYLPLDVTNEDDWKTLMAATKEKYGKLNVVVNNAGIAVLGGTETETLEGWNRTMEVNSTGVFLGTKYAIMAMKNSPEPCSIINRSSIDGKVGEPGHVAYVASKGAVTLLTKAAALECAENGYNIRVNSVHPGYILTPMMGEEARQEGMDPKEYIEMMGKMHPLGRVGRPIDVAYIDLYLASDESTWTTGAEFVVDGGYTAR